MERLYGISLIVATLLILQIAMGLDVPVNAVHPQAGVGSNLTGVYGSWPYIYGGGNTGNVNLTFNESAAGSLNVNSSNISVYSTFAVNASYADNANRSIYWDSANLYVPYTGATNNLNLGDKNFTARTVNATSLFSSNLNYSMIPFTSANGELKSSTMKWNATLDALSGGYVNVGIYNDTIEATNYGSNAFGYVEHGGITQSKISASGKGSYAGGYAFDECKILASGFGSFAFGYGEETCNITATSQGAIALGSVQAGEIHSNAEGSVALGRGEESGIIIANGSGALAVGRASDNAIILASGLGAFSHGMAENSGNIIASGDGSYAGGYSNGYGEHTQILSSGKGSFAFGYADDMHYLNSTGNDAISFGNNYNNNITNSFAVGFEGLDLRITSGNADFQDTNISTSGVVTAGYYLGNGSLLTNINTAVYSSDEIYVNKNSSNSFNFNETKLNNTINNSITGLYKQNGDTRNLNTNGGANATFNYGNFSNLIVVNETVGTELVTCGNFSCSTGWELAPNYACGVIIEGGYLKFNFGDCDNPDTASQTITITAGDYYTLTYTVTDFNGFGSITPSCGGWTGKSQTANGVYTDYFKALNTDDLVFTPLTTLDGYNVDNVSVKEINTGKIITPLIFTNNAIVDSVTANRIGAVSFDMIGTNISTSGTNLLLQAGGVNGKSSLNLMNTYDLGVIGARLSTTGSDFTQLLFNPVSGYSGILQWMHFNSYKQYSENIAEWQLGNNSGLIPIKWLTIGDKRSAFNTPLTLNKNTNTTANITISNGNYLIGNVNGTCTYATTSNASTFSQNCTRTTTANQTTYFDGETDFGAIGQTINTDANFSVHGTQGITASGTSCTITAIKGGIITGATCI